MKFNYNLSEKILNFLENTKLDEIGIGCSDSQVVKIEKEGHIYFLKIAKKGLLTSEYQKLKWLDGNLKVPKIVMYDICDDTEYLITESIIGDMVCSDKYLENPDKALDVIVQAFKNINLVSIEDCPFNVAIDYKLSLVRNNVENGLVVSSDLKEKTLKKYGSVENVLKYLEDNKFECELCFSHGDTSLPNIFADDFCFRVLLM